MAEQECWYRYVDPVFNDDTIYFDDLDEFRTFCGEPRLRSLPVERHTPCGVWLRDVEMVSRRGVCKRWVSKTAWKRYAYPTKERALGSYIARKVHHIMHAKRSLERARAALKRAEQMQKKVAERAA